VELTTQPPSSAEVRERVELYLDFPCGSSRPVLEETLLLLLATKPKNGLSKEVPKWQLYRQLISEITDKVAK
jgi:hypothetical protein